jgi:branched-chain amino acid transport system substrate-binding protein
LLKRLGIFMVCLMVVALVLSGCGGSADPDPNGDDIVEHTIVSLVPLTGVLSTFGENSGEVSKLAAAEINDWLEAEGKSWRLRLVVEDTQTEPTVGLQKMQSWFGEGVRFFSGPQASGVARECLAFANSNQILFVSQSSTSPALAISDDWLFRFCTSDDIQGPAVATIAQAAGVKHLIFSWRGDTWGDGLQGASAEKAKTMGIEIYPQELRYDPMLEDFTVQAASLNNYVNDLVGKGVALTDIGIVVIAFEEIAPYMSAANAYPQLKEVVWIGSDGTALSEALGSSAVGAEFAAATKFISPMNRPEEGAKRDLVRDHVQKALGRETDAYSYNTYDIVWSLALAIDEVGYDSAAVKKILPGIADKWSKDNGASGHVVLNDAGDRAFADYDLWMIDDTLKWVHVGFFDSRAGTINWEADVF